MWSDLRYRWFHPVAQVRKLHDLAQATRIGCPGICSKCPARCHYPFGSHWWSGHSGPIPAAAPSITAYEAITRRTKKRRSKERLGRRQNNAIGTSRYRRRPWRRLRTGKHASDLAKSTCAPHTECQDFHATGWSLDDRDEARRQLLRLPQALSWTVGLPNTEFSGHAR